MWELAGTRKEGPSGYCLTQLLLLQETGSKELQEPGLVFTAATLAKMTHLLLGMSSNYSYPKRDFI